MPLDVNSLTPLFYPHSVAVIGASSDPMKIGGRPIDFLKKSGFAGQIIPINPKATTIQGLPAFTSVADVPDAIDLAICAIPSHLAEQTVSDCAANGVKALIMFSAGFAEISPEGRATQQRMAATAAAAGMRLMGPNCMGLASVNTGMIASFHPSYDHIATMPRDSRIALVSQSGAFGGLCMYMALQRGIGISHMVTTGNEADVQAADCLGILAEDPSVKVIMLYLEGCNDGTKLLDALELARRNRKPVVTIKLGRTDSGAAAAQSHTAALAGSDTVFDAMFRQYGVYRAKNIEEFFDISCALAIAGLPSNNKVGIVTVSGGVGILMADDAEERGLDVAELPADVQRKFREIVPFAGVRNPLDVTGQVVAEVRLLEKAMDMIMTEGGYGSVVCFQGSVSQNPSHADILLDAWKRIRQAHPDVLIIVCGIHAEHFRTELEAAGIPAPQEPTHGLRMVAAARFFADNFARPLYRPGIAPTTEPLPGGTLNEVDGMAVLRGAGLPVIEEHLAQNADDAAHAANTIGYPVVLKLVSPDVLHKSDIGGVRLNLADADAVKAAFEDILAASRQHAPDARVAGCLVAPMVKDDGIETIIGVSVDDVFGPLLMFGLGGVLVETLGDVSFRVGPIDRDEARRMIDEIRTRKVLDGVRGAPASDVEALARALSDLSHFAAAHRDDLVSIEANPVLVRPKGEGLIALDAVVVGTES